MKATGVGAPDGSVVPGFVLALGTLCAAAPAHGMGQGPRWVTGAWGRAEVQTHVLEQTPCTLSTDPHSQG